MNYYPLEKLSIDLEECLKKEPLIAKELIERQNQDPAFLAWWYSHTEPSNDLIIQALEKSTVKNDYGEYDNIDLSIFSGWSIKRKGTGKSSVELAIKHLYDCYITENGFNWDEIFFILSEKLAYINENAGKLESRVLCLDENIPLLGASSITDAQRMLRLDDVCRIRGLNNIYVSPRRDIYFITDLVLETVWRDPINNAIVCSLWTNEGHSLGWVAFPRPKMDIWGKYQEKKRAFLKRLDTGEIRELQFKGIYEKLQARFDIETLFEEEADYYQSYSDWMNGGGKGPKPIKPKQPLTPKRLQTLLLLLNPETTAVEREAAGEMIYAMLKQKSQKKSDEEVIANG